MYGHHIEQSYLFAKLSSVVNLCDVLGSDSDSMQYKHMKDGNEK